MVGHQSVGIQAGFDEADRPGKTAGGMVVELDARDDHLGGTEHRLGQRAVYHLTGDSAAAPVAKHQQGHVYESAFLLGIEVSDLFAVLQDHPSVPVGVIAHEMPPLGRRHTKTCCPFIVARCPDLQSHDVTSAEGTQRQSHPTSISGTHSPRRGESRPARVRQKVGTAGRAPGTTE